MDRRDVRHRARRAEPARAEVRERVVGELELPDADRVRAGGAIRVEVLGEARAEGADLRDREPRDADAAILRAGLTSDQVWFRVRVRGLPARGDTPSPDDGG